MKKNERLFGESKSPAKGEMSKREKNLFKKVKTQENSSCFDEDMHSSPASFYPISLSVNERPKNSRVADRNRCLETRKSLFSEPVAEFERQNPKKNVETWEKSEEEEIPQKRLFTKKAEK